MLDHILHIQWLIFHDIQTVQTEVALDSWFPGLKFGHYAGAWMTVLLTIRPSSIHDSKWQLFSVLKPFVLDIWTLLHKNSEWKDFFLLTLSSCSIPF
jgi:hypothetical protein